MEITNPIYDVAFKYMMEDRRVAKVFLSALTSFKIKSFEPLPQELVVEVPPGELASGRELSVYRMDFSGRIRLRDGTERIVIIELQRTGYFNQTMRFRKYLGKQYLNDDFFNWATKGNSTHKQGIPIFPIYFLGEKLEDYAGIPVILVQQVIKNRQTKEVIPGEHPAIEPLFHEGIIVHVPGLQEKYQDDLEQLLSIFDPSNKQHTMHINETEFPKKFQIILRRLQAAAQEKAVRDKLSMEYDLMQELQEYNDILENTRHQMEEMKLEAAEAARKVSEAQREAETAQRKTETAQREAETAQREAETAQHKIEAAQREAEIAQHKAEEEMHKRQEAIRLLLAFGMTKEEITQKLGLSDEELKQI